MNEIEEKFYKCFGIKYKLYYDCILADSIKSQEQFPLRSCSKVEIIDYCKDKENFGYCKVIKVNKFYPPITDRVLLELICKLAKYWVLEVGLPVRLYSYDALDLKNEILNETFNLIRIIRNEDRKARFINEVCKAIRVGGGEEC